MTLKDGNPCKRCGTSSWNKYGNCRECAREQNAQWRHNNHERRLAQNRRSRQANLQKVAEYDRQWQKSNPDKVAKNNRQYRQSHWEKVAEYGRKWRQLNRDKANATNHRRRTRKTQAGGAYTADEFKALCAHYGNKCLSCGKENVKLTADHILPVAMGGSSNIDNIQPLCGKCNSGKRDRHIDYRPDAGPLRWLQAKLFG